MKNRIILCGYIFLDFLARIVPYPAAYIVAYVLAKLAVFFNFCFDDLKRNVSIVLGFDMDSPEVIRHASNIYRNWLLNVVDFLKSPIVSKEKLAQRVKLEGLENLEDALKYKKGVVLFTAHIGNFEWGAARLAVAGYDIWGTSLVRGYSKLDRFFEKRRKLKGLNTLYINKMLAVFRLLKKNAIVALPTDWDPMGKAKPIDFFDRRARIPRGSIELALKSGAPLIASFIYRDRKYTHHQVLTPVIELERDGDFDRLVEINTGKMIKVLEKYITKHIDHWELFHDIWEKR